MKSEPVGGSARVPGDPWTSSRLAGSTRISTTTTTATRCMPWSLSAATSAARRIPAIWAYGISPTVPGRLGEITRPIAIDYSDPASPEVLLSEPEYVNVGHEYTAVLPSVNLRFDLKDDLVLRASAAKVLSRPGYLDLSPRLTVQAQPRTMRGGNGELDPTTAVQFDVALEWYFADYAIASVGVFTKEIDDFVQPDIVPTPFPAVIDPETNQPLVLTAFRPLNSGASSLTGCGTGVAAHLHRPPAGTVRRPRHDRPTTRTSTLARTSRTRRRVPRTAFRGLSENTINFTVFYEKGTADRPAFLQLPRRLPRRHPGRLLGTPPTSSNRTSSSTLPSATRRPRESRSRWKRSTLPTRTCTTTTSLEPESRSTIPARSPQAAGSSWGCVSRCEIPGRGTGRVGNTS